MMVCLVTVGVALVRLRALVLLSRFGKVGCLWGKTVVFVSLSPTLNNVHAGLVLPRG